MRAVIEVYRGDQDERVALEAGQLVRLDDAYSIRLVELQP